MRLRKTYTTTPQTLHQVCRLFSKEETGVIFAGKGWQVDGSFLAGYGVRDQAPQAFDELAQWMSIQEDYVFCHLSYDVKNHLEPLRSRSEDHIGFPLFHCFVPSIVLKIDGDSLTALYHKKDPMAQSHLYKLEEALTLEDLEGSETRLEGLAGISETENKAFIQTLEKIWKNLT